mmetsp:Transcript_5796/g.8711  ORF Transcript_5796/g.8711 Transcript_5796/m.8711 type:complete len:95 (-) Transcript_5796:450-734(-)
MSESEIPIDQNATGGEPLPNEENEDAVEETGLALAQANIDDDGGDGGDENTEEDNNGHDDDDDDDDERRKILILSAKTDTAACAQHDPQYVGKC